MRKRATQKGSIRSLRRPLGEEPIRPESCISNKAKRWWNHADVRSSAPARTSPSEPRQLVPQLGPAQVQRQTPELGY